MEKDELHNRVVSVFADTFKLNETEITEQLTYNSHEKWDSLGHLELVSNLEKEFDISFSMDDVLIMGSVVKCEEIVQRYLAK